MAQMHERETFQKLVSLLCSEAPDKWSYIQSIYLSNDGAMKLVAYYKKEESSEWEHLNYDFVAFDIMDWWEAYHRLVKEAEGNEFKAAKAILDCKGNLKMRLSYEVIDPLDDIDELKELENI